MPQGISHIPFWAILLRRKRESQVFAFLEEDETLDLRIWCSCQLYTVQIGHRTESAVSCRVCDTRLTHEVILHLWIIIQDLLLSKAVSMPDT